MEPFVLSSRKGVVALVDPPPGPGGNRSGLEPLKPGSMTGVVVLADPATGARGCWSGLETFIPRYSTGLASGSTSASSRLAQALNTRTRIANNM